MTGWKIRGWFSWDTGAGAIGGICMYAVAHWQPKVFASNGSAVFGIEVVIAAAILAVVLATLTILTTFMTEEFLLVLNHTPTGVEGAFYGFRIIAIVSGAALLSAASGVVIWLVPGGNETVQQLYLTATADLTVWSVVGAIQLVFITSMLGIERAHLDLVLQKKRSEARRRIG